MFVRRLSFILGSGDFVVLGCDITGAVAYEMAAQLTRAGDSVRRLILIGRPFFDEVLSVGFVSCVLISSTLPSALLFES